ncbi:MAG: hypothetical protein ACRCVA_19590, partial [Phreatobacter sp.]
ACPGHPRLQQPKFSAIQVFSDPNFQQARQCVVGRDKPGQDGKGGAVAFASRLSGRAHEDEPNLWG